MDQFPVLRKHRTAVIMVVCFCGLLIGTPMVTQGGLYVFALFDHYGGGWILLINGLVEAICIAWVYGEYRPSTLAVEGTCMYVYAELSFLPFCLIEITF